MMTGLPPIEEGNRIYRTRGRFDVQLEVPSYSTLRQQDIDSILAVASWQGNINNMVDGYEGGRSVTIYRHTSRIERGTELRGLQISGVGSSPQIAIGDRLFEQEGPVSPPTTENFYLTESGRMMNTPAVVGGQIISEPPSYAPHGTYLESRMKVKVHNTRKARALGIRHAMVGDVECYGRYLNLTHNGERTGFIVFAIPDPIARRFIRFIDRKHTDESYKRELSLLASAVGTTARELHSKGHCHRQFHFGNFYFETSSPLYLMDWTTMQQLETDMDTRAAQMAIDVILPLEGANKIFRYTMHSQHVGLATVGFLNELLMSYFNDPDFDIRDYEKIIAEEGRADHKAIPRIIRERMR